MKVKREKFVYDLGEDSKTTTTTTSASSSSAGATANKPNLFNINKKKKTKSPPLPPPSPSPPPSSPPPVKVAAKESQVTEEGGNKKKEVTAVNQPEVKQTVKCSHDNNNPLVSSTSAGGSIIWNGSESKRQESSSSRLQQQQQPHHPDDGNFCRLDKKSKKCSSYSDPNLHQFGTSSNKEPPPFKNYLCPPTTTSTTKTTEPLMGGGLSGNAKNLKKVITLWQNYYPEGGWGWIVLTCAFLVQCLCHGSQLSFSMFSLSIDRHFKVDSPLLLGMLGSCSMSTSLLLSPLWISLCKRKSTRLTGIFGGLITSLALLFTSFASQFHQLFLSYGIFLGVGVGLSRDASSIMVGQYFKRKRDLVEVVIVSGSGIGLIAMTSAIHSGIGGLTWRLGLQAVTGSMLISAFLGICYRSASLYHPQRRAILHLKNQRRKVKEKYKRDDSPPFFDFTCLKSKTLRILLLSSTLTSFGINVPLIYLSWKCKELKMDEMSMLILHIYLGTSWLVSCLLLGILVIQKNDECRISKQYLCQGSGALCGLSIVLLGSCRDFNDLGVFVWVYGFFIGAYNYTLKIFTYDRATTRHFPRAWSFIQFSQGIPLFIGSSVAGFILSYGKEKLCFYLAAATTFCGSALLFLADVRRRNLARQGKPIESFKKTGKDLIHLSKSGLTFSTPLEQILQSAEGERSKQESAGSDLQPQTSFESSMLGRNLASISEEGFAEVDFQDIYFEDWEEMLACDAITSCDKVENCLASEGDEEEIIFPLNHIDLSATRFLLRSSTPGSGGDPFRKHRFNAIDGIGGPAMKVATGVVGIRPPPASSSALFSSFNKWRLCEIAESESFSSPTPGCSENMDLFPCHSAVVQKHSTTSNNSKENESETSTSYPSHILPEIPSFESLQRKKMTMNTIESHSNVKESST